jgi:hypothetical protein
VEAAQVTVRSQPQRRKQFFHLAMRRGRKIAKSSDGDEAGSRVVLDVAAGLGLRRNAAVRFAGSKIRVSCWSTHCFDPVPEAAKFPNHSISAPAS